ncbi:hypothetical protein [Psychrobacter okhotskensis]|uniref:hypothetical protein n=1 Tax=Psychrobacter okhotskensis TaxID=212403 RepID=UPI001918A67C|nr:hypothetical protein [Psychrobacter okhotskensis]
MKILALGVLLALGLSACTNGLNDGLNNAANIKQVNRGGQTEELVTQYPVETAMVNIYAKASQEVLYTTIDEMKVSVAFDVIPKGMVTFAGKQVQASEMTSVTTINNQIVDKSIGMNYFTLEPLVFYGFTSDDEYSLATQTAEIPKLANVGASSTFLTENVYTDSNKRKKVSRYTQGWSLAQATPNTAWLCINSSENLLLASDPDGTLSECYRITENGDIVDSSIENSYPTESGIKTMRLSRG